MAHALIDVILYLCAYYKALIGPVREKEVEKLRGECEGGPPGRFKIEKQRVDKI